MTFLKNHPFAVEAFFESSIVLTFAVPKEQLERLIPACVELDTFQGKWAFIAVAMVQTSGLRPKGFPKQFGNDFFLIGYRIFVRYLTNAGKRLRGLYILKSETDKKKMEYLGNIFTHYNYQTIDIQQTQEGIYRTIKSNKSKFQVAIVQDGSIVQIPEHSPFHDWKDARKFAGPLPFTFSYDKVSQKVLIVEGIRQNWDPVPIKIATYSFGFFDQLNLKQPILANAFEIKDVAYYWKKGKIEKWQS